MLKWLNSISLYKKVTAIVLFESFFLFLVGFVGYHYSQAGTRFAEGILTLALTFAAVILSTMLVLFIAHIIIDPIHLISEKMKEVAKGYLKIEPVKVASADSIGELGTSFNMMVQNLNDLIEREQSLKEREKFLREIMVTSINSLDIKDTIMDIITRTGELFKADQCFYIEYDADRKKYMPIQSYESYVSSLDIKDAAGETPVLEEMFPFEKIKFGQRQVLSIENVSKVQVSETLSHIIEKYGIKSVISAPIFYQDKPLGFITLTFIKDYRKFSQNDIDLLSAIANQSAIVMYQAKAINELKNVRDRESLLRTVIQTIRSSLDINYVLKLICKEIAEIFKVQRVTISQHPPDIIRSEYTVSENVKGLESIELLKPVIEFWANALEADIDYIKINNVDKDDIPDSLRKFYKSIGGKSVLGIPIKSDHDKWGGLALSQTDRYRYWTQDEINLLKVISGQIYTAIKQAELYSSAKQIAERESLLRTIINEVLVSTNLEEALLKIATEVGKLFDVDRIAFRLYDAELNTFTDVIGEYRRNELIPSAKSETIPSKAVDDFLHRKMIEEKDILEIKNIDDSRLPEEIIKVGKRIGVKSTVLAPIISGNEYLGIINLTNTESYKPLKKEEIDLLTPIIQQVSIGIKLFRLNDMLGKNLNIERILREIIINVRKSEDHDQLFNFLLDKITSIFNTDRALHLHYTPECNLKISNEVIKNIEQDYSVGQDILNVNCTHELIPEDPDKVIMINDVNIDIKDITLREYLKNKDIYSFMLYPIAKKHLDQERISGIIMLCTSMPRKWSSNEMESFKLIVDTATLVYNEIRQRKESEEQRRTFLATLTHDLRSPINAEQKALESILSGRFGKSLENFSEYLEDMQKTNEELLRIVNNLLMTYHYESGRMELLLEPVNIKDVIDNAVKSMKPLAKDNNSEITTEVPPDLPLVSANKDEIARVITNLINNAIKHNPQKIKIIIFAKKIDSEVEVSISDNGLGIPKAERSNIFHKYPTTKRKIGTGLGLYLSKQIIDAHHGKIWFMTEEGKGTTFSFTLPVS